ncbi:sugar ABC transporter permease [Affinibrenneria salicis]|uniref:Sugar ABC transporter permease n=1 Tax=Affinibrenneria salicis TaxID=2590031 RepID=A0A5J5FSZ3_9GAMM|nr:sugar ABC transporter permease [Affinibrenneria salicis]KAA8996163.1 sugar ABC transporter permease [Affinibrenneria salicis]
MLFDSRRQRLALLLPAVMLLAALTLYPIGQMLIYSFSHVDYAAASREWAGWDNYRELFSDWFFTTSLKNTLSFSIAGSLIQVGLGLGLALLLYRPFRGRQWILSLLIYPMMLSTLVCSAIWRVWFHYDFGLLNSCLRALGLMPLEWLSSPQLALLSVMLVDIWQWTPMACLIILAGLQSIPKEVLEAAQSDGANRWRQLWHIILPLIRQPLMLALLLRSIDTFKLFDKVYALTGGGPGYATETLSLYIYQQGFKFFNLGLASAAAVIMLLFAGALSLGYAWQMLRRPDHGDR